MVNVVSVVDDTE